MDSEEEILVKYSGTILCVWIERDSLCYKYITPIGYFEASILKTRYIGLDIVFDEYVNKPFFKNGLFRNDSIEKGNKWVQDFLSNKNDDFRECDVCPIRYYCWSKDKELDN
jgi:hypothetical protein